MNKKIEPGVPPSSTGQGFNRARTFIQPARVVEFNVHWPDVSFTDEQLKAQAHGKYVFQSDRAGACSLRTHDHGVLCVPAADCHHTPSLLLCGASRTYIKDQLDFVNQVRINHYRDYDYGNANVSHFFQPVNPYHIESCGA
jgi:hypothetical protein